MIWGTIMGMGVPVSAARYPAAWASSPRDFGARTSMQFAMPVQAATHRRQPGDTAALTNSWLAHTSPQHDVLGARPDALQRPLDPNSRIPHVERVDMIPEPRIVEGAAPDRLWAPVSGGVRAKRADASSP